MITQKDIETAVKKALKDYIKEFEKACDKKRITARNYFKETQELLKDYTFLNKKIEQDELDIADLEIEPLPESTGDIIRVGNTGKRMSSEEYRQYQIDSKRMSMVKTKSEIKKVDNALNIIKSCEWYQIIELHYFQGHTFDEVAKIMHCDESTVRRHKNDLIRKICILLHGQQARERS